MATIASRKTGPEATLASRDAASKTPATSLWDLVRDQCLARAHKAVRVLSEGRAGLLFFDAGRIVHAETAHAAGESAALEILTWQSGSFDACQVTWPRSFSISCGVESLVLRATKARAAAGASNLVAFPTRAMGSDDLPPATDPESWLYVDDNEGESEVTKPGSSVRPDDDLPVAVRVGADGTILEAVDDQLADAVAYAARLASLIGELLGLEGFRALECTSKDERVVIYTDAGGDLVGGRAPIGADVGPLRSRLGL
ncbi:MAG TPA: DUF4388 domain-containing protein [Polyangia bacterium]|nr:DUF4388 domain-containing protein [Polyangia bacterium]